MRARIFHIINSIFIILFFVPLAWEEYLTGIGWIFKFPLNTIRDIFIGIALLIWPIFMIRSFKKTNVENEDYRKSAIWNFWAIVSILPTAYLWLILSNLLHSNAGIVAIIPLGLVITSLVFFVIGYRKNKL